MLTRLQISNFKTLEAADIPLGQNVVLIGPNNSGKTSALQALALWQSALKEWTSRRSGDSRAIKRPGVTLNRRSLTHTPVLEARFLWRDLKVNTIKKENGKQDTQFIYITIDVEGEDSGKAWSCGFEFYYANPESFYCRPIQKNDAAETKPTVSDLAAKVRVALLPPMSGLATEEAELQPGRIDSLLGEGQTAQVLRNLCFLVAHNSPEAWRRIVDEVGRTYGVQLSTPRRDQARGTIELGYRQREIELDLSSAGRGMQQTLLLLAHLHANPGSVLLLDEPDAHLEILRQRQTYSLITEAARATGSQVIAASHSEVVLNEAADKDVVVAFVGAPHRIDDRGGSQVLKSLKDIGFDQYYQAELKGFVLYLEGATDLAILAALAQKLKHAACSILNDPFVFYVGNVPKQAEHHFYGIREAKPDMRAVAIFDRRPEGLPQGFNIVNKCWLRREVENYLCTQDVLLRYAAGMEADDLVGRALQELRREAMAGAIERVASALRELGRDPWSPDEKVSDEFLPRVFQRYFENLGTDNRLNKSDFHVLADFLKPEEIDPEVVSALDLIVREAELAKPRKN